jgi:hypothetical protein
LNFSYESLNAHACIPPHYLIGKEALHPMTLEDSEILLTPSRLL